MMISAVPLALISALGQGLFPIIGLEGMSVTQGGGLCQKIEELGSIVHDALLFLVGAGQKVGHIFKTPQKEALFAGLRKKGEVIY